MARRAASSIAVALACLLLTACAPEPAEQPPATSPRSTEPEVEQTESPSEPEEPSLVIPDCEELVATDSLRDSYQDDLIVLIENDAERERLLDIVLESKLGPVAVDTLQSAERMSYCIWARPNSDLIVTLIVAELTEQSRDELTSALNESVYTRFPEPGGSRYSFNLQTPTGANFIHYLFSDEIWVTEVAHSEDGRLARSALESLTSD